MYIILLFITIFVITFKYIYSKVISLKEKNDIYFRITTKDDNIHYCIKSNKKYQWADKVFISSDNTELFYGKSVKLSDKITVKSIQSGDKKYEMFYNINKIKFDLDNIKKQLYN